MAVVEEAGVVQEVLSSPAGEEAPVAPVLQGVPVASVVQEVPGYPCI